MLLFYRLYTYFIVFVRGYRNINKKNNVKKKNYYLYSVHKYIIICKSVKRYNKCR